PAAKFDAAKLRAQWESAAEAALDGVARIEARLRLFSAADVQEAGDILGELVDAFPNGMDPALDALDKAAAAGDAAAITAARTAVKASVQECLEYLKANADLIKTCEINPYGVSVAVSAELKDALKQI